MGACCGAAVVETVPEVTKKQSDKAEKMLLRVFSYYDKNNDQKLTMKELKNGIAETGLTLDYVKESDVDGDQLVSKTEWVNFFDPIPDSQIDQMRDWLLTKQSPAAKDMLLAVYAKYDTNKDESLSFVELKNGIKDTGLSLQHMAAADKNGDDKVSKEEWLQFFDPIPDAQIAEMKAWLAKDA